MPRPIRKAARPVRAVEDRSRKGEQQLRRAARAVAEVLERTCQGLEASPEVTVPSGIRYRWCAKSYRHEDNVGVVLCGTFRARPGIWGMH
jgi:hypothetical protein